MYQDLLSTTQGRDLTVIQCVNNTTRTKRASSAVLVYLVENQVTTLRRGPTDFAKRENNPRNLLRVSSLVLGPTANTHPRRPPSVPNDTRASSGCSGSSGGENIPTPSPWTVCWACQGQVNGVNVVDHVCNSPWHRCMHTNL